MSQTWLTADWHIGEDRMEIMQRPFANQEEYELHDVQLKSIKII